MGNENKKIDALCIDCGRETHHEILATYRQLPPEEYDYYAESLYSIIKCCGCDNVSFLHSFYDYEDVYINDEGKEECRVDKKQYPPFIKGYQGLRENGLLPEEIRKIYNETLDVLKNDNLILAGIGLRTIIEAIAKNKNVNGKSLNIKINKLAQKGFISKADAERLHAIRFIGNDSAHEIMAYEQDKVIFCFEIIENILKSLYVFDEKTVFFLEMPVRDYSEFLRLIKNKLEYKDITSSNDFTIRSLLGKDIRKTLDKLNEYEQQLIKDINDGVFSELEVSRKNSNGKGKEIFYYTCSSKK